MNNTIQPKNDGAIELIADCIVTAVIGLGGASVGYAYGYLFKTERLLTAKLVATYFATYYILTRANEAVIGSADKDAKRSYTIQLVGSILINTIALIVCRRFNIIGNLGTGLMTLSTLLLATYHLDQINPKPPKTKTKATDPEQDLKEVDEAQSKKESEEMKKPVSTATTFSVSSSSSISTETVVVNTATESV